jgi:hypothetical protein
MSTKQSNNYTQLLASAREKLTDGEKQLFTVMSLALFDGVFPVLILTGALDTLTGSIQVGILVFSGSATAAVIFGQIDQNVKNEILIISKLTLLIAVIAVLEAMLAPVLEQVLSLQRLEVFAAIALGIVALDISSSKLSNYAPSPLIAIGVGIVVSFQPTLSSFSLSTFSPILVTNTIVAVVSGGLLAIVFVLVKHRFGAIIDLESFQHGSAISLGLLVFAIFGVIPTVAPLVALGVTSVLALEV